MAGFHNITIYTADDNPWCKTCINGEEIVGTQIFFDGGYICHCNAIPTIDSCDNYIKRLDRNQIHSGREVYNER